MAAQKDMSEFQFQLEAQQSIPQEQETSDAKTYTDPNDGTVYEWDNEKRGWFPKIDGNFLAAYHSSYGYYNPEVPNPSQSTTDHPKPGKNLAGEREGVADSNAGEEGLPDSKKSKQQSTPGWFDIDSEHNTNVYVSNIHEETTDEEFLELMTKCGIIMKDEQGHPKVKLYCDSEGNFKGDALCCYLKIESVALAMQLLDESDFKGQKIHVERAKFQMKGAYNPSLKKRKRPNKKKKGNAQERLLDWRERKAGPGRSKYDRVVIFKHLFRPEEFENDPMVINEIKDDLREECSKMGEVKKVLLFDRNEEGVASVTFKDFEAADQCIAAMNGRYYGGQQLEVFTWDGVTKYEIEETEQERKKRLEKWESYLETKNDGDKTPPMTGAATPPSSTEQTNS